MDGPAHRQHAATRPEARKTGSLRRSYSGGIRSAQRCQSAPEDDSRVALSFYLEQAKKESGEIEKVGREVRRLILTRLWNPPSADPFILEMRWFNMDRAGELSEHGAPFTKKPRVYGESALTLAQVKTITVHGRELPNAEITEFVQPGLKRIRAKVQGFGCKQRGAMNLSSNMVSHV